MSRVDAREIYDLHARVCKAIADPKRLLILDALRDGPRSVGEIAADVDMSQPVPKSASKARTVDCTTPSVSSRSSTFSSTPRTCTEVKFQVGALGVSSYTVGET